MRLQVHCEIPIDIAKFGCKDIACGETKENTIAPATTITTNATSFCRTDDTNEMETNVFN